jgi:hypothetical protein
MLNTLPTISELRKICKSLAVLDCVLMPEWEFRYYSYDSKWSRECELASMRNGSGDYYFIHFNPIGIFIKGYFHESNPINKFSEVMDQIPSEFNKYIEDPALLIQEHSFLLWRKYLDTSWSHENSTLHNTCKTSNLNEILFILDGEPKTYKSWADSYYEIDIPLKMVEHIYAHELLSEDIVYQLNSEISIKELTNDLDEIGYPELNI